eukprot:scaffold8194_cov118-Cylindrotheca_fusiformis.AAC.11
MESSSDDADNHSDIESGTHNSFHQSQLNSFFFENGDTPDIPTASTTEATTSASSDGQGDSSFATVRNLQQIIWNGQARNVASDNNGKFILQTLMRVIVLMAIVLNSMIRVPLSYINGSTEGDDEMTGQNESGLDANKKKSVPAPPINKGIVATSLGRVGYLVCDGRFSNGKTTDISHPLPLVCIHACRRSSDEYLEVLELVANYNEYQRKVVAIDLFSHGMSQTVLHQPQSFNTTSILNNIADAVCLEVALSLGGMEKFVIIAHGAPAALAMAVASRYPFRVMGLVIANMCTSFETKSISDASQQMELKDDGSHLLELHNKVRTVLDPDLKLRIVKSELDFLVNERFRLRQTTLSSFESTTSIESLIAGCNMMEMSNKVKCPTLCIRGALAMKYLDENGLKGTEQFESIVQSFPIKQCEVEELSGEGSSLYMINQAPTEFFRICMDFFQRHSI